MMGKSMFPGYFITIYYINKKLIKKKKLKTNFYDIMNFSEFFRGLFKMVKIEEKKLNFLKIYWCELKSNWRAMINIHTKTRIFGKTIQKN